LKAIIVGAPIQLDGEPAEIAQLVDLLTSGRVAVEHTHRWRIDELDGADRIKGRCWCGQERDFDTQVRHTLNPRSDPKPPRNTSTGQKALPTTPAARRCKQCGGIGHDRRKCPQLTTT
jgi:hypothetical protein